MNVCDSRVHNYPPRWKPRPAKDLLVIRRNHQTGDMSSCPCAGGLIPYWCRAPKRRAQADQAKCETGHSLPTFRDAYKTKVPNNAAAEKAGSAENRDNTIARGCHGSSVSTL